jgi:CubicO group peptidase (beta-lactamase class C family)
MTFRPPLRQRPRSLSGPPACDPGTRFSYSNLGYQFLSLLMQEVEGRQFPDLVRRRVLAPAGMDSSAGAITNYAAGATRDRLPVFPRRPSAALRLAAGAATWAEHAAGDANVAMTPSDLASLLTALEQRGGKVLSAGSFERMFARAVRAPPLGAQARYGYGVIIDSLDGREVWWNSGATQGFRAFYVVEPRFGAAAGVLMNGPGNARRVGEFALRTLRAVLEKSELPPVPSLARRAT